MGFGRGFDTIPEWWVDLGVEEVVARRVGASNASIQLRGGRAVTSWRYEEAKTTGDASLTWSIQLPLGYSGELRFPATIGRAGDVGGRESSSEAFYAFRELAHSNGTVKVAMKAEAESLVLPIGSGPSHFVMKYVLN